MLGTVITYLLRFGRSLRGKYIRWIADRRGLSETEVEEQYGRPCVVCKTRFTPRFEHHHLCSKCEDIYIKCWTGGCDGFFQPKNGRRSETYCPECRAEGKASDLLERLIDADHIEAPSRFANLTRPVFRLTKAMIRSKRKRETERTEAALESWGISEGDDEEST